MEKTLKLRPQGHAAAVPRFKKPDFARVALALMLGGLLATLACGKLVRPDLPRPPLLPPPPRSSLSMNQQALASAAKMPARTAKPEKLRGAGENLIACRLELETKRLRMQGKNLFPACTRAFGATPGCGRLKQEFLEALYLYAYAFQADRPESARSLIRQASPMLADCPPSLPLRQRALELARKLAGGSLPKTRKGMH